VPTELFVERKMAPISTTELCPVYTEQENKEEGVQQMQMGDLFAVFPAGPPDFGGMIAELLWGVQIQYSSAIEYLKLVMGGKQGVKQDKHCGARRIVTPELFSLLRSCTSVRRGILAAVAVRKRTIEPNASDVQRYTFIQLCDTLKERYSVSWKAITGCWADDHEPSREWPPLVVASI